MVKGSVLDLDDADEAALIAEGDANRVMDFATAGLPVRIYQSHVPVTITGDGVGDTTYRDSGGFTVPAGTMNLNGELVIVSSWDAAPSGATTTKSINLMWGGVSIGVPTFAGTTQQSIEVMTRIKNANSLTTQRIHNTSNFGVASTVHLTKNSDTAGAVAFLTQGKFSVQAAAETLVMVGLSCWYYPGAT
jgi:hypothetical protein